MGSHIHKKLIINAREDRISSLPDELVHHILRFLDAGLAVRTSILSKRWKFIWTTLPFLFFNERINQRVLFSFVHHVFNRRNHDGNILKLKLHFENRGVGIDSLKDFVKYAIDHNVQDLDVGNYFCDVSELKSNSIKKLDLSMDFGSAFTSSDDSWYLPALTSLHLKQLDSYQQSTLPASCLICLPALTDLRLEGFDLDFLLSLPGLTKLHLENCEMPQQVWNLPALVSLELHEVDIDEKIWEFLSTLVNLQHLKLLSCFRCIRDCFICCPQLLNLELITTDRDSDGCTTNILISAPKLLNVNIVGIFSITCCESKLENVYVKLNGYFDDKNTIPWGTLKRRYRQLMSMFGGLDSARILRLDWDTIEALCAIVDLLESASSPFHNLKYLKLPQGYKESRICGSVKNYLLGGSPQAIIITTLQQNDLTSQNLPVSLAPQNLTLEVPFASPSPTIDAVNSHAIHKKVCTSGVVDGKVGQICAPVHGFGGLMPDAPGPCSKGNTDIGLWRGYEVNSEFVGLLDLIMKRYPQTFEQFTTRNKKLRTMKLNMLCTSVIAFTTTTVTDINTKLISEYRTLFSDLQRSFNVKWLVSHLNYIEQFLVSQHELHTINSCVGNAKRKSQVPATVGAQKTKVNLNASLGYIGDDLLQDLTNIGIQKTPQVEELVTNLGSSIGYSLR